MTLTEFLLARIAEREGAARATQHADGPTTLSWKEGGPRHSRFDNGREESYSSVFCGEWDRIRIARDDVKGGPIAAHIALNDPARVLAGCAALRLAVEAAVLLQDRLEGSGEGWWGADADDIVRHLATAWADHPDYRKEWRP